MWYDCCGAPFCSTLVCTHPDYLHTVVLGAPTSYAHTDSIPAALPCPSLPSPTDAPLCSASGGPQPPSRPQPHGASNGRSGLLPPRPIHLCRDELVDGWGRVLFRRWSGEGHVQPALPQRAQPAPLGVLSTGTELQLLGRRPFLSVWQCSTIRCTCVYTYVCTYVATHMTQACMGGGL